MSDEENVARFQRDGRRGSMKSWEVQVPVERASGYQVFLVKVRTAKEAEEKFKKHGGECILYEEVEVTELNTEYVEVIGEHKQGGEGS
jgi:predicted enzyme related to lactoylglutathione lyase